MNTMQAYAIVDRRTSICFLCKWIEEDLRNNGKLTGYPLDSMGGAVFPAAGKERHLELEKASMENR
jgi:hypothetical protein